MKFTNIMDNILKRFHIPPSIWRKYNFYEVFPVDGGGSFIFQDLIGSENDVIISRIILKGDIFKDWGKIGNIDWDKLDIFKTIERSVWLNRLYVLGPLARMYWLTGEEKYSETFVELLLDFIRSNPPPKNMLAYFDHFRKVRAEGEKAKDKKCGSTWWDMQVSWRVIVICWSFFFLEKSKSLSPEIRNTMLCSLREHGDVLFAIDRSGKFESGNHQSFRGLALFYLGALFPEFNNAGKWHRLGLETLKKHLERDFNSDGGGKESSPSYFLFTLMHYREIILLANHNKISIPPVFNKRFDRMYEFLLKIIQPDGTLPVINDGFEADVRPSLSIIRETMGIQRSKMPDNVILPQTGFAIFKTSPSTKGNYFILDLSKPYSNLGNKELHWHAGKLGFTLWGFGKHLTGDSGCCNYDQKEFSTWYRRAWAHNTILVDGQEDALRTGCWTWDKIPNVRVVQAKNYKKYFYLKTTSDGYKRLADPVNFTREVYSLKAKCFLIRDILNSRTTHQYQWLLNIYPSKSISRINNNPLTFKIDYATCSLLVVVLKESEGMQIKYKKGLVNIEGKDKKIVQLCLNKNTKGKMVFEVLLFPCRSNNLPSVKNIIKTLPCVRQKAG